MRKLSLIAFVIGLGLGVGVAALAGVSAWLDWVTEPFRQPPSLQLGAVSRPPLVGAQPGQAPAPPTAVPATLEPATRVRPTSTSMPPTEPSTPQPHATPPSPRPPPRRARRRLCSPRSLRPWRHSRASSVGWPTPTARAWRCATGRLGDCLPGKGYDEGEMVTTLEQQGEWTHIRGNDGRDGWVLTVTLVP